MPFIPIAGNVALPRGSSILVTGVTGYIATHIVAETLSAGYKVRGTARTAEKAEGDEAFHSSPNYHCVVVSDSLAPGAFDKALEGIDGVIHVAMPTDMKPDPNEVIPALVNHLTSLLESCSQVASIKRFVYMSSSTAATLPVPGRPGHLDKNTWNEEAVKLAWAPPHPPEKGYTVYGASKVEAEKAMWKWVEEKNPHFVVNAVLPDTNYGQVLQRRMGPTGRAIVDIYEKNYLVPYIPAQWMVDVRDCAKLFLIALLDSSLRNERLYAFDEKFTWNQIIDIMSELKPKDAARLEKLKIKDEVADATTVDNELGGELLKKWYGQEGDNGRGWTGLRKSVEDNMEDLKEYAG